MATATAVGTEYAYPMGKDNTQRRTMTYGSVAISASPATYAAGGLAFSFASPVFDVSSQAPIDLEIKSISGSGYVYQWVKSTGKVKVFTGAAAQSPLTEVTDASAIPAGVSGDVLSYKATFNKGGV